MELRDALIYEYGNHFWIIQRSPQSEIGSGPSENVALAARLPLLATAMELGSATLQALENFGTIRPLFAPWEIKELRKLLCGWIGARSMKDLLKNGRLVLVDQTFKDGELRVLPFDNHRINPWETLLEDKVIALPLYPQIEALGAAILTAFDLSTYHPERKHALPAPRSHH